MGPVSLSCESNLDSVPHGSAQFQIGWVAGRPGASAGASARVRARAYGYGFRARVAVGLPRPRAGTAAVGAASVGRAGLRYQRVVVGPGGRHFGAPEDGPARFAVRKCRLRAAQATLRYRKREPGSDCGTKVSSRGRAGDTSVPQLTGSHGLRYGCVVSGPGGDTSVAQPPGPVAEDRPRLRAGGAPAARPASRCNGPAAGRRSRRRRRRSPSRRSRSRPSRSRRP